jgi:hypothetical protein
VAFKITNPADKQVPHVIHSEKKRKGEMEMAMAINGLAGGEVARRGVAVAFRRGGGRAAGSGGIREGERTRSDGGEVDAHGEADGRRCVGGGGGEEDKRRRRGGKRARGGRWAKG